MCLGVIPLLLRGLNQMSLFNVAAVGVLTLGRRLKSVVAYVSARHCSKSLELSVFEWFETDGLISQRRDWLIGFKV